MNEVMNELCEDPIVKEKIKNKFMDALDNLDMIDFIKNIMDVIKNKIVVDIVHSTIITNKVKDAIKSEVEEVLVANIKNLFSQNQIVQPMSVPRKLNIEG